MRPKESALVEEDQLDDAEIVVISYGITSRVAQRAIDALAAADCESEKLRLITAWPFPRNNCPNWPRHIKAFVVPELNLGQNGA